MLFSLEFLSGRKIEPSGPPCKDPPVDRDPPRLIKVNSFAPIRLTFGGGPTYETVGICLLGAVHTLRLRDMANHRLSSDTPL